jgi:hypothetical protein
MQLSTDTIFPYGAPDRYIGYLQATGVLRRDIYSEPVFLEGNEMTDVARVLSRNLSHQGLTRIVTTNTGLSSADVRAVSLEEAGLYVSIEAGGHAPHSDLHSVRTFKFTAPGKKAPTKRNENARLAGKATGPDPKIWNTVKIELHALICTDAKRYKELRSMLTSKTGRVTQQTLVLVIAAWIASVLGLSVIAVTPVVSVALMIFITFGKNVYCANKGSVPKSK